MVQERSHVATLKPTNAPTPAPATQRPTPRPTQAPTEDPEEKRLRLLREDPHLPLVWMDVSIGGEPQGRMEFVLFPSIAPRAAENFRLLMTGEKVRSRGILQAVASICTV